MDERQDTDSRNTQRELMATSHGGREKVHFNIKHIYFDLALGGGGKKSIHMNRDSVFRFKFKKAIL